MASIDSYFEINEIDIDSIIEDIMLILSPAYMSTPVLQEKRYIVPARVDEDYAYYRIPIQDKIITNILNSVQLKSEYADITSVTDLEETTDDPDEFLFGFAFHGRNMLINNATDETIIGVQYSEIPLEISSLQEDIYRYLKQAYYYALTSDFNSLYQILELLSKSKDNILNRNLHTEKSRRSNQVFNIGLFKV